MKYHCVEATWDIKVQGLTIRLWVDQGEKTRPNRALSQAVADAVRNWVYKQAMLHIPWDKLIEFLATIPDINAFQIKEQSIGENEFGVMIYTVPFTDDSPLQSNVPVVLEHGINNLRNRGFCMARKRDVMDDGREPIVAHDCFEVIGHKGNHKCAPGCTYEWPNDMRHGNEQIPNEKNFSAELDKRFRLKYLSNSSGNTRNVAPQTKLQSRVSMKTISLRVGDKKSKRAPIKVPLQIAENATDMLTLAKGAEAVVVRCFNRGFRIENQERSGARDAFKAGKTDAEIAAIVASYDASVSEPRASGPRKPKTIVIPKGKKDRKSVV